MWKRTLGGQNFGSGIFLGTLDMMWISKHQAKKMCSSGVWEALLPPKLIAEEVKSRINDEPGPAKSFMTAHVSEKKDEIFFSNTDYLISWKKAGKKARPKLPGHHYFDFVDKIRQSHLQVGELYIEFNACDRQDCPLKCSENPFPAIESVPRLMPNKETGQKLRRYTKCRTG